MSRYVILDIDNTLCETPQSVNLDEFHAMDHLNFKPKKDVLNSIHKKCHSDCVVIYITARDHSLYFNTLAWLNAYGCTKFDPYNILLFKSPLHLFMRPNGNTDKAAILKLNILKYLNIKPEQVELWLDDDSELISEAKTYGFTVIHPDQFITEILND